MINIESDGTLGKVVFEGMYGLKIFDINVDSLSAKKLGKERGHYITINTSSIIHSSIRAWRYAANVISEQIKLFLHYKCVLVVGLGNAFLAADNLGSKVISSLFVTHDDPELVKFGFADVSALITGVSGINGYPTSTLVKSVVEFVKPQEVIVIDTFVAHDKSRVGTSFQLSDTGITAGAGIGRKNKTLSAEFLGVPVLSIGVPLMINVNDLGSPLEWVVVPKEIDILTRNCAYILSRAINLALHGKKYFKFV